MWSKCITGNGHYISISKWNIYRVIAQKSTSNYWRNIYPYAKKDYPLRAWNLALNVEGMSYYRWALPMKDLFSLDYSYSVYVFINILSMFLTGFVIPISLIWWQWFAMKRQHAVITLADNLYYPKFRDVCLVYFSFLNQFLIINFQNLLKFDSNNYI